MSPSQYISAFCPTLYTDRNLLIWIDMATAQTGRAFFGTNYDLAIALRACHIWTLNQRSLGESGAVSSKTEGELSISFQQSGLKARTNDNLDQTHYGKQLKDLIHQQSPAASVTGVTVSTFESGEIIEEF